MKRVLTFVAPLIMLAGALTAGDLFTDEGTYDFYGLARYPQGGKLVEGVDLYTVQEDGGPLDTYARRVVDWWPRKGVDAIEVVKGMPLRTWTLRAGPLDSEIVDELPESSIARWEAFESPANNVADNYRRIVSGYIHPPRTGEYIFKVCADDTAALYLSTDDNPANKRRIAGQTIYAMKGQWERREGQVSLQVRMEGGKRYYIEATHTEFAHGDHLEVGWEGPGVTFAIVDGEYLSDSDGNRGGVTEAFMPMPPTMGRKQPFDAPRQFAAHLIGFRGIGNTMSSKYQGGDGSPIESAVVLRLADGRKRMFPRNTFCQADKAYIMDIYVKAMDRIKAGLDKTPYEQFEMPGQKNSKPGEPGVMWIQSDHFVFWSGSQGNGAWINETEPEKAEWYREGSLNCAEYMWALQEYAGGYMPSWGNLKKRKYKVTVAGTVRDGYQVIPGNAGGGVGACILKEAGGGPWSGGLFHEWGHGHPGPPGGIGGGGEAAADTHATITDPAALKGNEHLKRPWRNVFNGMNGYGFTSFYVLVGDDPNWGYAWAVCLPYGAEDLSALHAIARIGQERGMFSDGIRGVGDVFGEHGARLATFDCELEDLFCREYFAPARSWLEPVDPGKGVYRIPFEEAPEPFGVNIVRLAADAGADEITVDFTGLFDPERFSDWRACLIAVGADKQRRYSPMWNRGRMSLKIEPDDICHWLSVAATPRALYVGKRWPRGADKGKLYSGKHAFRYPWSVRLAGARPGTPREQRVDLDDASFIYEISNSAPAPHDTPEGRRFLARAKAFERYLDEAKTQAGGARLPLDSIFKSREKLETELARMTDGARHPNGGGWVQSTATVSPTAYVGPNAMVLDQARVLDNAIVEDFAIVTDRAVVADRARVSGQAVLRKSVQLKGFARTWMTVEKQDQATLVPRRPGDDKLHEYDLWANYAMDRDDNIILEDWYRYTYDADKGYGMNLVPVLNGYLQGHPDFVNEDGRKGFCFDGKAQYAELCPRLADLGEITVDIVLKPEDKGDRTIFDLGSSPDDCLVLKTGREGKPELIATVNGKTAVILVGKEPLATGEWTRLRVESDGKRTSLWIDNRKVDAKESDFRPCDVFPAGETKRNFLAVSRGMSGHFKGIVDHVVVYHGVHEDFSALPPPTMDSPVRPTAEFVETVKKQLGEVTAVDKKIKDMVEERMKPYEALRKQKNARREDLLARDKGYVTAVDDLAKAEEALEKRKKELTETFNQRAETIETQTEIDKAQLKLNELNREVRVLQNKAFADDEELRGLQGRRKEVDEKRRERINELRAEFDVRPAVVERRESVAALRKRAGEDNAGAEKLQEQAREAERELNNQFNEVMNGDRACGESADTLREIDDEMRSRQEELRQYVLFSEPVAREQAELQEKVNDLRGELNRERAAFVRVGTDALTTAVNEAKGALADATDKAMLPYAPEEQWMQTFEYHGFNGYYNTHYHPYVRDHVEAIVGGGEMREDVRLLGAVQKAFTAADGWHTRADWDGSNRYQSMGRLDEYPLVRKWLKRVGGWRSSRE